MDGAPMTSSFTTGYFYIAEGEEFSFVDLIIPDFKWNKFGNTSSAQVQISFNVIDYPGDTPTVYGPYTMNSTTEYITVRFRGRQASITVTSSDIGSFWRLGRVRYRYAPAGRR
jgi:V8-like Glu-specific endopeptidase